MKIESGKYAVIIKRLWIGAGAALVLFVFFVFAVSVNLFYLFGQMPSLKLLENPKSDLASELYTADGKLMGKYFTQNRSPVEYEQISPNVIKALLAAEDVRFYKHSGVDFKATLSLPYYMLKGDSKGGSTISQQLAKNLFAMRGGFYAGPLYRVPGLRILIIKAKEWITAIHLERNYAKEEIVTMYLNTVEFGSNAFGIKVAAKTFFDKLPSELTVTEGATLVGIVNLPTRFNPVAHPQASKNRRNVVMAQMVKYGYLPEREFDRLKTQDIDVSRYSVENQNKGLAPYLRTVLQDVLLRWADAKGYDLYSDGLKIHTTIDSRTQRYAEETVATHMKDQQNKFFQQWGSKNPWVDKDKREIKTYIQQAVRRTPRYRGLKERYGDDEQAINRVLNAPVKMRVFTWNTPAHEKDTTMSPVDSVRYYKRFLQTGFLSMDPATGWVKAWVGGIDYKYFKYDHVRQGRRQPGSTFKPIVYATAIDNGFKPCDEVLNIPVTLDGGDGKAWTPNNFDNNFDGETMTLRQALGRSVNTIAAYLMGKVGPTRVVEMAKRLGITSPLDAVPSLALGTSDVTLYEMLGAYSTFVNGGTYTEPYFLTRIEDKYGNVLQEFPVRTYEAISEETAYLMVHMLRGSVQERGGTSMKLHSYAFGRKTEFGGKTGTTQDYADGWFIGITPGLVSGLWVGGDEPSIHFKNSTYGQGGR
ncbi:MAG: transglycosylase domain-containing protein, partial [Ferruginibacter sp.]|nr:transglycosylase domain-containing protein [Cytophagales bacterium]